MIQLNLLPSVKQEFIKTQRLKNMVVAVSFAATAAALAVFVIALSTVYVVQKKLISDLNSSITTTSASLRNVPNISDMLTVQSQLSSLSALHAQKPVASRVFGYLAQLTPTQATISDLRINYTLHTIVISGNAPGLDVVNTFVDGLKFTNYSIKGSTNVRPAFTTVVLSSFSRSSKSATYSVSMTFDPTIFDVANDIMLSVGKPGAQTEQPSIIFKKEG